MNSSTNNNTVSSKTRNITAILLVIFFPVGLILMWSKKVWTPFIRVIITVIFVLLLIIGMGTDPSATELTSPTQGAGVKEAVIPPEEIVISVETDDADEVIELTDGSRAELQQFQEYAQLSKKLYFRVYELFDNRGGMNFSEFVEESIRTRDRIAELKKSIETDLGTYLRNYQGSKYTRPAFIRVVATVYYLRQAWFDGHRFASFEFGAGNGGSKEDFENSMSLFIEDFNYFCSELEELSQGEIVIRRLSDYEPIR